METPATAGSKRYRRLVHFRLRQRQRHQHDRVLLYHQRNVRYPLLQPARRRQPGSSPNLTSSAACFHPLPHISRRRREPAPGTRHPGYPIQVSQSCKINMRSLTRRLWIPKLSSLSSSSSRRLMMTYSSTVSAKRVEESLSAEDRTAHHVRDSNGTTIRFQNPHPSLGRVPGPFEIVSTMQWYVSLREKLTSVILTNPPTGRASKARSPTQA